MFRLEVTRQNGQKSWRRVVTGNSETRIRDYIKGVPQVKIEYRSLDFTMFTRGISIPFQVKFIDKLSFMFGVTCIVLTEFLALREPQWFTMVILFFLPIFL